MLLADTNRWLMPEGVEELLPPMTEYLERLRRQLLDLYASWGYELVMPPFIEYLDALLTGTGEDLALQTFTLTDQMSGRLLGIRADMTPQVARIDAHPLRREVPSRLCYLGTVLRTRPDSFGGSRSPLQVGVELYGHAGVQSDFEVLSLMLETLHAAKVFPMHLDLGHVGVYRALAHEAGLAQRDEMTLFDALQRKAKTEIAARVAALGLPVEQGKRIVSLCDLNGGAEVLAYARAALAGASQPVQQALEQLEMLCSMVGTRYASVPLHIDLAELRAYQYQTGIVFAAFVPGHGQEVARGGRYDEIGKAFGRARPATGFSADLKTLVACSQEQMDAVAQCIWAPSIEADPAFAATVTGLRARGERVIHHLPGQVGTPREMGCDREITLRDGRWVVAPLS
jgi:ATP phosphoribosyltransferase regulatory subunit